MLSRKMIDNYALNEMARHDSRERQTKPALEAVKKAFAEVPFPTAMKFPPVSVVVCSYNGSRTIRDCFEGLSKLDYPDCEAATDLTRGNSAQTVINLLPMLLCHRFRSTISARFARLRRFQIAGFNSVCALNSNYNRKAVRQTAAGSSSRRAAIFLSRAFSF
jgi:cellulose synthase/poly-beta-1,6-N-acetylglucosamine synthase-like glycosyltransferase